MAPPNRPVEAENGPARLAAYGSPACRVRLARALGSGMPNGGSVRHTQLFEPFLPLVCCPQIFCASSICNPSCRIIERRARRPAASPHALATTKLLLDLHDPGQRVLVRL